MKDGGRTIRMPSGIGVYVRNISRRVHGSPHVLASKARRYGLSFVALQACWQDDRAGDHRESNKRWLGEYGAALRDQGVDVWVWGYPTAGKEARFVETMHKGAARAGAAGLLLDPERSYKKQPESMKTLLKLTRAACSDGLGLGLTSYGLPKWHAMPWEVMGGFGFGSPQLYTIDAKLAKVGMAQWRDAGWTYVIPSIGAYGRYSRGGLRDQIARFGKLPGFLVWSWCQIDPLEWNTLHEFAKSMAEDKRQIGGGDSEFSATIAN